MPAGKVDWDSNSYDESHGGGVIPKGEYLALIKGSESKKTKDKNGTYFEFEFQITAPNTWKGRGLHARLNVHNASETAQRIGREQFNSLVVAAGFDKGTVKTTSKLHGKLVVIFVEVKRRTDQPDKESNEIVGFRAKSKTSAVAPKEPDEPEEEEEEPDEPDDIQSDPEDDDPIEDDDIPF